ncbi:hypothetical protein HOP38_02680 [Vibrio mediterranei]|uniref:hypothetical protein n=1 Tax=Vibrio mediterranei TaxID=689 RepID=UPI00185E54E4|nr:hypothetical protein [Vibrio mediterranei]NUW71416.1 hypothetical protein [Vibrio mediterranei]
METKLIKQGDQIIEHSRVDTRCIDPIREFVREAAGDRKFAADNAHIARIPEFVVNEINRKHGINLLTLPKGDTENRARFMQILRSEYPQFLIRKNG